MSEKNPVDKIVDNLGLDAEAEDSLRKELSSHFEEAVQEWVSKGLDEENAARLAAQEFGSPRRIRRGFIKTYSEVYLVTTIGRIIYSKPAVWTGMILASLVALAFVVWGSAGIYELTQLPPGPTAWHDADSTPLFMFAFALPVLVLFTGTIIRWIRKKAMPDKLLIWTAGLMVFLFLLADMAVK